MLAVPLASHVALLGGFHFMVLRGILLRAFWEMTLQARPCQRFFLMRMLRPTVWSNFLTITEAVSGGLKV